MRLHQIKQQARRKTKVSMGLHRVGHDGSDLAAAAAAGQDLSLMGL